MTIIITGVCMSKKRGMSKQQRLYYEYQNKDRIKEQLEEIAKHENEIKNREYARTYNPHEGSYFT
jgi:hypothetical protein